MREPRRQRDRRPSLAGAFAWAAVRYWLTVFPQVARELRHWRRSANRIADPSLRALALASLAKRANMEGAAAFATFVPWRARGCVVRALVAFQAIYNYADMLAEQPSEDPVGTARHLHQALLVALDPSGEDSLAGDARRTSGRVDGDYLAELIAACETASWQLPSYGTVAPTVCLAAERIVSFQSLSLGHAAELEAWAERQGPGSARFAWWELAAAAGSSLSVHALIAAAARPELPAQEVVAIEAAYFPCIGALHSLLDSLVDAQEDAATGQLRLLDCYPSPERAAERLQQLATGALKAARQLPRGVEHALLVTAMACSYLAAPEASAGELAGVTRRLRGSLGPLARPVLLVFALRGRLGGRRSRTTTLEDAGTASSADVDLEARSADARAA